MIAPRTAHLVLLAVLSATSASSAQHAESSFPLHADLIAAWRTAGARPGWLRLNPLGPPTFELRLTAESRAKFPASSSLWDFATGGWPSFPLHSNHLA
jgi:hypothetical protein